MGDGEAPRDRNQLQSAPFRRPASNDKNMALSKVLIRTLLFAITATALSGCGTTTPTPENSAWAGLASALGGSGSDPTQAAQLSPTTWYLKVQIPDTPPALLAFGYLETQTSPPTEVWFSGAGQFIKLRAGRIVATHGLATNWKNASVDPGWPEWSTLSKNAAVFTRTRSTLPNYDFGIRETLQIAAISKPAAPVSGLMPGADNGKSTHWRWFEESVLSSTRQKLPSAVFATAHVKGVTVVAYSQQCLSENLCLHIMRWPQLESEPHPW